MSNTTKSADLDPRDEWLRRWIVESLGPEDHRRATDMELEALLDSCGELRLADEQMELILRKAKAEIANPPSASGPPRSKSPRLGVLGDVMDHDGESRSPTLFSGFAIGALIAVTIALSVAVAVMVCRSDVTVDSRQVSQQAPSPFSPAPSNPQADGASQPQSLPAPAVAVARVAQLVDCRWADSSKALAHGDKLPVGQVLEMEGGVAEIDFGIGARLILQGPATLELLSPKSARLDVGKATVEIQSERARGFRIVTAETTFIDQGTEFGVEVPPGGGSKVHVFKGAVDVDHASAAENGPGVTQRLQKSIGARMAAGEKGMTLVEDTGECFIRSMDEAQRDRHLVAWWRFEDRPIGQLLPETNLNTRPVCATVDSSFNGNDLHVYGHNQHPTISADVASPTVPQAGVANRSCMDNSHLGDGVVHRNIYTHSEFSHAAPLDAQQIAPREWTIEASVKAAQMPPRAQVFLVRDGTFSLKASRQPPRLSFQINEAGRFAISFYDAADRFHEAVADGPAAEADRWYHLAATSDGRQLRLYVDILDGHGYSLRAKQDLPAAAPAAPDSSTALGKGEDDAEWAIGRSDNVNLPQQQFVGWIDEVRISDIARQPDGFLFADR